MKIDGLTGNLPNIMKSSENSSPDKSSFADYLKNAIGEVNALQNDAQLQGQALITGDVDSIHQSVIAYEKASLSLQLAVELRNKVVEAYQEIMRIQL
ncbi:MAG: flagellar hook-basal body complex protein FliE [Ignavibacteriales bacterium]